MSACALVYIVMTLMDRFGPLKLCTQLGPDQLFKLLLFSSSIHHGAIVKSIFDPMQVDVFATYQLLPCLMEIIMLLATRDPVIGTLCLAEYFPTSAFSFSLHADSPPLLVSLSRKYCITLFISMELSHHKSTKHRSIHFL